MGSYFLSHIHALGGGVAGYVVPFLFVLSLVVFFHELGHFLVARLCGVQILTFSIGFGPELAGFNDRYGTRWKIAAIPLGGYVKFFGDENAGSAPDASRLQTMNAGERAVSFHFQPVWKRAAIVVAGPLANFLLAIVIFAAIFMIYGKQTMSARVDTVQADSAAAVAGFEPGDIVLSIDGEAIDNFTDMQRIVSDSAGRTLAITVYRNGGQLVLKATPALKDIKDTFGNVRRVGILGMAFKENVPDTRNSKVADIIDELRTYGLAVQVHDPLADVGLPDAHRRLAIRRSVDHALADRERADGRGEVAAVARPVDHRPIDRDLAEQVVDVAVGPPGFRQDDDLAGARGGAAHAVGMLAVRIGAADHAQQQALALGGIGRQVVLAEEHALAGAAAHVDGGDAELLHCASISMSSCPPVYTKPVTCRAFALKQRRAITPA